MITKYDMVIVDGVPSILSENNQFTLIDTGSPFSFSSKGSIEINGVSTTVPKSLSFISTEYLTKQFNCNVVGLIGMDIMKHLIMEFDYNNKLLIVSDQEPENNQQTTFIEIIKQHHTIPIIQIVDPRTNTHLKAIIDTGAKYSYVSSAIAEDLSFEETINDFNPLLGNFQASKFSSFEYVIGERKIVHPICTFEKLNPVLKRSSVDALLGFELLSLAPWILNYKSSNFIIN